MMGIVLLTLTTLAVLAALLVLTLRRPGAGSAGLVGGGVTMVLLLPAVTTGWGAWRFIRVFSQSAAGSMSGPAFVSVIRDLWSLQRLAWGGVAVFCVLALGLAALRRGTAAEAPAASTGRAVVIVLLPLVALAGAGTLSRDLYKVLRIAGAVVSPPADNPAAGQAAEAVLAAEGLPTAHERGTITAISDRIAWGAIRASLGSVALAVLFTILTAFGFSLAWERKPPPALVAGFAALWIVAGLAGGLVGGGLVDPLRGLVL